MNFADKFLPSVFAAMVCVGTSFAESQLPSLGRPDTESRNVTLSATAGLTWEQKPGQSIPEDLVFTDQNGQQVQLGNYLGQGPVVLGLVYYNCPNICTVVIRETFQALQAMRFQSHDKFTLLFVSINPDESWELAAQKRTNYLNSYKRADFGRDTHFLVGSEDSIKKLASAIGFGYRYDTYSKQYVHPAGLTFVSPAGKISRYLMGTKYEPIDFRLALVETSEGKIGDAVDRAILFCYKYDPTQGKYGFVIMSTLRIFGGLTVTALGAYIITMLRRERRRKRSKDSDKDSDSVR